MKKKLLAGLATGLFLVGMVGMASAAPTKWSSEIDGNDHWYDIISGSSVTWTAANTAATGATYSGMQGYLASITSDEENEFVASLFTSSDWVYNNTNGFMGPWIGGYQPDGSTWTWTSGEVWNYTAWESNQPSNQPNQDYVHYYIKLAGSGNPLNEDPTWNDHQDEANGKVYGYVVEYNPVPIPATLLLLGSGLAGIAGTRIRRKKSREFGTSINK